MQSWSSLKKKAARALAGASILSLTIVSVAGAAATTTPATNTKAHNPVTVTIPEKAVQVAENVFSVGTSIDPESGKVVQGYMIVHYKKAEAKPGGAGGTKPTACYGFLAKGAKWKSVESWVMNTTNNSSLSGTTVFPLMEQGISKWESAATTDILGNGSITSAALSVDQSTPDGQNEVYFAGVDSPSAIAVTTVWGIFSGPVQNRELVEWDMVFDDVKFAWSTSGEADKMDFDNIATHELGHAVGLADLYTASCSNETMYGYASEGETNKRDLNTGDIQGVNTLY